MTVFLPSVSITLDCLSSGIFEVMTNYYIINYLFSDFEVLEKYKDDSVCGLGGLSRHHHQGFLLLVFLLRAL